MRKLWFLAMVVLLTACGSGGGGSVSQTGATGTLKVQTDTIAANQTTGKTAALVSPQPQFVRVVVHKAGFTTLIQDVQLGSSPTFILPVGTGYLVDCISFATGGGVNRMLQYGEALTNAGGAGLAIADGATTTINVTGADIATPTVNMPLVAGPSGSPNGLYAGDTYTVASGDLSSAPTTPLQAKFNVNVQAATDFTTYPHVSTVPAVSPSVKMLSVTSPTTVYARGEFYIDPAFLKSGESQSSWVINSSVSSAYPLYVHGGGITGIGTGLFADTYPPQVASFSVPAAVHSPSEVNVTIAATDNVSVTGYLVTESAALPTAKPASGAAGWQATSSFAYPFAAPLAPGTSTTLWAWAKDPSGNVSDIPATGRNVKYDNTPQVLSFSVPDTGLNPLTTAHVTPISIEASSSASGGITSYQITQSDKPLPSSNWSPWTSGASTMTGLSYDITGLASGAIFKSVPLYAWVKDANGTSMLGSAVAYDTRPVVDTFAVDSAVQTTNTVAVTALTGTSHITTPDTTVQFMITTSATKPTAATPGWAAAASWTSFTFATKPAALSKVKLNAWALDSSGVVSTGSKSAIVQF